MTDSEKLDKILENQELIKRRVNANCALLNALLDMACQLSTRGSIADFEKMRDAWLVRVDEYLDDLTTRDAAPD